MLLKIAIRNVFRHKRRTFFTVFTMAVGLMFFIFFDSMFVGIDRMLIEELIKFQDSSIVIYSKEYDENKKAYPLNKPIKDVDTILKVASSIKNVEGITPRTQFLAELIYLGKSQYIIGTIVNPQTDTKVFDFHNSVKEGRFFDNNKENEILIGSVLAKKLGVTVGDTITLSAQTKYETYNAVDFVVCGILETVVPTINESTVVLTFNSAEELLDLECTVTSLHIKISWPKGESIPSYTRKVTEVVKELQKKLGEEYKIYSFKELYNEFIILMKQKRISSSIIIFFILLISAVGIVNTILMAVYERIKEIGVLMAMGLKPKEIRRLFLFEGGFIGVIGGLFGILLGFLVNLWLVYLGWNLEKMYGETATGLKPSQLGMPVWGTIYGEWNIYAFIFCFCFGILIAIFSSYFPARYASKLQITNCLRHV